MIDVKQGEIYLADLGEGTGREYAGERPVLIVSNDAINWRSSNVIVSLMRSYVSNFKLPIHVILSENEAGLGPATIMLDQVKTIDKQRFIGKIGKLSQERMEEVARVWNFTTITTELEEIKRYSFEEIKFVKGRAIELEEDYEYEFKEIVDGVEPRQVINDKILPYMAAFLNGEGGKILFGIRDDDHVVTAFTLTDNQKDDVKTLINSKIDAIQPRVSPASYSFLFHDDYDEEGTVLEDTYVLEINVLPPSNPSIVYFLDKNKIYSKVNGGKKPLEWSAIQDFIQRKMLLNK